MKVFRVVTEQDGKTERVDGGTRTAIERSEYRYAAETMQEVLAEISWLLADEERTVIAIIEEAPAITIIAPNYK